MKSETIFHLVDKKDWAKYTDRRTYEPPSLEEDGYIHCSTAAQVEATANRFFKNSRGLLLVIISVASVDAIIKYEDTMGHGEEFPHIYGTLNLGAVLDTLPLIPEPDGSFYINIDED